MKKLKHIFQLDPNGCSIAALAMIVGKEYFELRKFLHKNENKIIPLLRKSDKASKCLVEFYNNNGFWFSLEDMIQILMVLFYIKATYKKFYSLQKIKKHSVFNVMGINKYEAGHAIVFDAVQRKILDPGRDETRTDNKLSNYNVATYIEID